MDLNEDSIKAEVSNFVSSLQRLLPKKKDIIVIEPIKAKLLRLSDIHTEAKSVFPKCFIGTKLIIVRQVLDKVKLVQQYNYGKTKETYQSYKQYLNKEMEPKHINDGLLIDSNGSATATYTENIEGAYTVNLTSKIKDLISSETEVEIERESERSVTSFSFKMNDMEPNTLKTITQWMYKVHPDFSIGTELGFKPLSYPALPELSVSTRYGKPTFSVTSTVSRAGFQVCVFKKLSEDLRLATIIDEGQHTAPVTVGLALHKTYADSELKIFVDTQRCGGFTFQKDVYFRESNDVRVLRLVGSTLIDGQRRVRFGFGINLDF
ncbi:mitochondrial import receptor subunit TOM40 homolog [Battus philenor]|uniref:mitochondrial import receptor subunit TOM40 homolog n=1 Tax=Battus philenor TaxID=42288 RepID=UPI0035D13678